MPGNNPWELDERDMVAAKAGELFPSDLEGAVAGVSSLFDGLKGARIFMTGGTGFVGRWMLESLLVANVSLGVGASVVVLTRDPQAFRRRSPHLARAREVELLGGDVRSFDFPSGRFDCVIHLAAETNTQLSNPDPAVYFDVIVGGTRRVLDFAERAEIPSVMMVSSGAVYGTQPETLERLGEDDPYGAPPTHAGASYGEAKRFAELLTYSRGDRIGLRATVARCFSFVGPYLPLDSGFAVGNFISDALNGTEIVIRGDGTPRRTYLYAGDMATWLWSIALAGRPGTPYNVGSDEVISVSDLAHLISTLAGGVVPVRVLGEGGRVGAGAAYIPDVTRARTELGLRVSVGLHEAVVRTLAWHRHAPHRNPQATGL